jgi:dihydroneopterin aldolase/D-erythro-7,8-dihydroneopterin triphosphate epimerase
MADLPLDRIHIRDLRVRCIVGVFEHERHQKQDVVINLTLHADLRPAGQSDRLEDTVDYKALKQDVIALAEESSCLLVERLAERVAEVCLSHHGVQRVDVLLEKPGALRFARTVGVEISRGRAE